MPEAAQSHQAGEGRASCVGTDVEEAGADSRGSAATVRGEVLRGCACDGDGADEDFRPHGHQEAQPQREECSNPE